MKTVTPAIRTQAESRKDGRSATFCAATRSQRPSGSCGVEEGAVAVYPGTFSCAAGSLLRIAHWHRAALKTVRSEPRHWLADARCELLGPKVLRREDLWPTRIALASRTVRRVVDEPSLVVRDEFSDGPVLTAVGELDWATSSTLRDSLVRLLNAGEDICLDLSGVSFCDSSGVSLLVWAHKAAAARGIAFEIKQASRHVLGRLDTTGLRDLLGPPPT
jgi:anti-sigma B factor antagonist